MLPCGEVQRNHVTQESRNSAGANMLERFNSAAGSVDLEHSQEVPNMLVVVLAGFQATSRTSEPRVQLFSPAGKC